MHQEINFIKTPAGRAEPTHPTDPPAPNVGSGQRAKLIGKTRALSWQRSLSRSNKRSSTFRATTNTEVEHYHQPDHLCEELKHREGLGGVAVVLNGLQAAARAVRNRSASRPRVTQHRLGARQGTAGVVLMLVSDADDYVNGQTIAVDGGITIRYD